jgi:hypothetical protein
VSAVTWVFTATLLAGGRGHAGAVLAAAAAAANGLRHRER